MLNNYKTCINRYCFVINSRNKILTFGVFARALGQALFEEISGHLQFLTGIYLHELLQVGMPYLIHVRPFEQGYSSLISLKRE